MTRQMLDTINADLIPKDWKGLLAGYINGNNYHNGTWNFPPSYGRMKQLFPHNLVASISVDPSAVALILDCEKGDAIPQQCPAWATLCRKNKQLYPCVYTSFSQWGLIVEQFHLQKVDPPLWWIADYDGIQKLFTGTLGKQYMDGPHYDYSIVADYWPGLDPAPIVIPKSIEEFEMEYIRSNPSAHPAGNGSIVCHLGGGVLQHVQPAELYVWQALNRPITNLDSDSWNTYVNFIAQANAAQIQENLKAISVALANPLN